MGEGFSSVLFLYGIVVVLAVGKACTRLIWRTLPRPGLPVRQETRQTWLCEKLDGQATHRPHSPTAAAADGADNDVGRGCRYHLGSGLTCSSLREVCYVAIGPTRHSSRRSASLAVRLVTRR
jgi:hypothetical protein